MNVQTRPGATGAGERNYPLDCWWVAATSGEITRKPLGRWLLDTPIVLFRTQAGEVVALEDRCLHRWAPLSPGALEGDAIVCPYHGARFGTDGRCLGYPNQTDIPANARIRAFTTIERGPFVWIWLGSAHARQAAAEPPDFPFTRDPSWTVLEGGLTVAANYMLFHENLLDLTHFNYLHRNSLGITSKTPPRYWSEGNIVRSELSMEMTGWTAEQRAGQGIHDPDVIRQDESNAFMSPAYHLGALTKFSQTGAASTMLVNHFMTPQSPGITQYWWHLGLNPRLNPEMEQMFKDTILRAFNEDAEMLASIQNIVERDPRGRDYIEISFKGDLGGIKARQALNRIMAADGAPAGLSS